MNPNGHALALRAIHDDPRGADWSSEVRAHVATCARCEKAREALGVLLDRMRSRASESAPPELVARLRTRIREESTAPVARRSPARVRRWQLPASLAAGLALGLLVSPLWRQPAQTVRDGEVVRTVADYLDDVTHDRFLLDRTGRPLELVTDDSAEASRWLAQGLGFEVALASPPAGFELEGARVWHTVSRLSALAVYRGAGTSIAVFAVPRAGLDFDAVAPIDGTSLWAAEGWGFDGVAWIEDDLAWSAVGDLPRAALVAWVLAYREGR